MVPFPVTLSDLQLRFQGHGVIFMPIDALSVLCAQLTRDLLAIAKFLYCTKLNIVLKPGNIINNKCSFLFLFLSWDDTQSLRMPALRPASQAGPMHNPRNGDWCCVARHHQTSLA